MKTTKIFLLLLFISVSGLLLSYGLRSYISFIKGKETYGFGYGCGYRKPHHHPLAYMESQTIAFPAYTSASKKTVQPFQDAALEKKSSEGLAAQITKTAPNLDTQFDSSSLNAPLKPREELKKSSHLKEWGAMSGFLKGNLRDFRDYEVIPLILRLGFDLKPFFKKFRLEFKGFTVFELEPFIGLVISPNNNIEIGSNFLLKYAYPLTKRIYPYAEAGLGVVYMSQHTREQATQYNFLPQVGAGIQYFLKENVSINAGYRYRHLSNASLKHPNKGIDVHMFLTGASIFY